MATTRHREEERRESLRKSLALRLHDRSFDELVAIGRVLTAIERREDILRDLRERAAMRGEPIIEIEAELPPFTVLPGGAP